MAANASTPRSWAAWVFIGASLIALLLGFYGYFAAWGIKGTLGALIVLWSSGVLLAAALLRCLVELPRWLGVVLDVVIGIDLLGTLVATYFLEAYLMLAFTLVAAIGWIAWLVLRRPAARQALPA